MTTTEVNTATPTPLPRILIVDDEPRNLDALEAMLAPFSASGRLTVRYECEAVAVDVHGDRVEGIRFVDRRARSGIRPPTETPVIERTEIQ